MNKTIVGLQWGDEGKGKLVDYFAEAYDYVCRFNGGSNAGHTLYYKGNKIALHLIPSGILHKNVKCVIGRSVIFNIEDFFTEIASLKQLGFKEKDLQRRIFIDDCCHVVEPKHLAKDVENVKRIGSTGKGIGPCTADKYARTGLRLKDLKSARKLYKRLLPYLKYPTNLKTSRVLCEGAQSIMLDISYGEYPYVTSSHTLPQFVPMGLKDAPAVLENVGVFKAYLTKVSTQGFATELQGEEAEKLRELGKEYGATTGRPRRVGWLDIPQVNESIKIGNISSLILTKTDILKDMKEIKVCYKYSKGKPVYKTFKPWKNVDYDDVHFMIFLHFIESKLTLPINWISKGPNREDML